MRALSVAAVLGALALVGTACGSSGDGGSTSAGTTAAASTAAADTTAADTTASTTSGDTAAAGTVGVDASQLASESEVQSLMDEAFGGGVTVNDLPPIAQEAYKMYAKPITSEEKKVIERCLTTSGVCDLGKTNPEAKLAVAESEDTDNPYYKSVRAVYLLQALREPTVKSVNFTQASFKVPAALSNFRSHISQGADVIVGAFDLGDVMLPVVKQAAAKGIPVWSSTQTIPSAKYDGTDLAGDTLTDLCAYGKTMGEIALKSGKNIAMYTGTPGNTYAPQWQECAKQAIKDGGGTITTNGTTNWTPQGEQQAAAALAAKGLPDAIIYDYAPEAFIRKFLQLGKTPPTMVGGSQTMGSVGAWLDAKKKGKDFKSYIAASEITFAVPSLHAAVATKNGIDVEKRIKLPQPVVPVQDVVKYYSPDFPAGANFGSGLPKDILQYSFSH
ncbi:substrate-binding domain-containing protein [Capillimicrobium parvum]|uniref:substrate-binding domain-containing protein n=1 Tax=Capillimicrobium parvum TaxID=2884022 RepID=UPI00216ADF5E|nr:substrate-binding domain-containing protein [Capillimicrobium parvum]